MTEIVKFNKTNLVCPIINGEPHVVVKSIIDGIGLNYTAALRNLKNHSRLKTYYTEWYIISEENQDIIYSDFGLTIGYSYAVLPIRKVAAWLYSIQTNSVKEPARSVLINFQDKCDDVLFQHFFGKTETEKNYFSEKNELIVQMRTVKAEIKALKAVIENTEAGKQLAEKEKKRDEIKLRLDKLENKTFGSIHTLFDTLEPKEPQKELPQNL